MKKIILALIALTIIIVTSHYFLFNYIESSMQKRSYIRFKVAKLLIKKISEAETIIQEKFAIHDLVEYDRILIGVDHDKGNLNYDSKGRFDNLIENYIIALSYTLNLNYNFYEGISLTYSPWSESINNFTIALDAQGYKYEEVIKMKDRENYSYFYYE